MQELIDRYCRFDRTGADGVRYQTITAVALVENGLLHKIPAAIVPFVRTGPIAIVCDVITRAIAADALDALLQQAGFETVLFELAPSPGEELPNCDDATIDRVAALLATADFGFAIAVGAGMASPPPSPRSSRTGSRRRSPARRPSRSLQTPSSSPLRPTA